MDQDWETLIVRKRVKPSGSGSSPVTTTPAPGAVTLTGQSRRRDPTTPSWKIERRADAESGSPIDRVDRATAKAIVQARVAAGMTQSQLAQAVNVRPADIGEIERGTAVRNGPLLARIRRVLHLVSA
jgi:ribosome-binding protein aMBF1 (putative translation factor)